jgi:aliphatic nitrilase
VEFATFPETVVPYYPYFSFIQTPVQIIAGREYPRLLEQAVTIPSAATDAISDACRRAELVVSIGINERDSGSLYNTQLLFDADGTLIQRRRKTMPTYHERMIWGQGDGSGLRAVDSKVGRIGQLACWEHYNPLARYAMMADGEQIHSAMYPGSIFGDLFSEQTQVNIRQHALESGCFVVCATAWLDPPAGADREGHWWQHRPDLERLLYRDRRARRKSAGPTTPLRGRRGHRRP